jgi:hypothetical protein
MPTANHTVTVPPSAKGRDVLELAIDAAKAVDLPSATKIDKANGLVAFGAFGMPVLGYTAQVRQRSDGQLDVTVKRGSVYVPLGVDEKAKEFVTALETRLAGLSPQQPGVPGPQPTTASPASQPVAPALLLPPKQPEVPGPQPTTASPTSQPVAPALLLPPTKDTISRVQVELKKRGFDPGPPDGSIGPKTRKALRRFQQAQRVQMTGEIDTATLEALGIR